MNSLWFGKQLHCLLGSAQVYLMPVSSVKNSSRRHAASQVVRKAASKQPTTAALKFLRGNAKLGREVWTFSLPSGHTCPGACACLAKVDFKTNRLVDGPKQEYRCFSASNEVAFRNTRDARRHNLKLLSRHKTVAALAHALLQDIPAVSGVMRVHVAGDFYSQAYFDAWMTVAAKTPHMKFYAYTKSIPFWINWINRNKKLPANFSLTASLGGKFDDLIRPYMITAEVVMHPDDAKRKPIDHDDSHARSPKKHFALLLHGMQKPGTASGAAMQRMRDEEIKFSYSRLKP